ncbi:GNAT family N-acetyltransferase [Streptomyces sp. SID4956]|nr:GNAT family N-acetyltransferase [Streptomyces sp. SID4956]
MTITYEWRGDVDNDALNALHAEGFGGPVGVVDWRGRLARHSLGWVCARDRGELVGFVNVAWDGGVHAFLLDTVVARRCRGGGVGTSLVRLAAEGSRAAGCQWLHVDFEEHLRAFYLDACGFRATAAGLIALQAVPAAVRPATGAGRPWAAVPRGPGSSRPG